MWVINWMFIITCTLYFSGKLRRKFGWLRQWQINENSLYFTGTQKGVLILDISSSERFPIDVKLYQLLLN